VCLRAGTPVQNNLGELHALMEFATPRLLGSAKDFKMAYEKPISAGQDRCVTLEPWCMVGRGSSPALW
jgi:SNF2 family DNA or RNA helicase